MPPRPLTRQEWLQTRNRGGWTYSKYVRWWNNTVRPRLQRSMQQAEFNKFNAMFKPLSPKDMLSQAEREAEATLTPQRAELDRLRRQQAAYYAQRSKDIQGFGLASADMLKSIGPQIQAGYAGAAGETASFAKGFADANTQLAAASAQGANEVLAAAGPTGGAPAGQGAAINAAAGAGALGGGTAGAALHDVTYGLGEMQASGLAREGAAFGAAASFLPAAQIGTTNMALRQSAIEGSSADKEFVDKLTELEMTRPDLVNKVLSSLRDYELQKRATWINQQYLGIKSTGTKVSLAKAKLDLQKKQIDLKIAIKKWKSMGINPNKVSESLSAGAGHLVDIYGNDIRRNGKLIPYTRAYKPTTPKQGPNKTQAAVNAGIEKIYTDVSKNFITTAKDTDVASSTYGQTISKPKYTWAQARNQLWSKYGNALMGYAGGGAARKRRIESAITQSLLAAGYLKPRYTKQELQGLSINTLVKIATSHGYTKKPKQRHDTPWYIKWILAHQR